MSQFQWSRDDQVSDIQFSWSTRMFFGWQKYGNKTRQRDNRKISLSRIQFAIGMRWIMEISTDQKQTCLYTTWQQTPYVLVPTDICVLGCTHCELITMVTGERVIGGGGVGERNDDRNVICDEHFCTRKLWEKTRTILRSKWYRSARHVWYIRIVDTELVKFDDTYSTCEFTFTRQCACNAVTVHGLTGWIELAYVCYHDWKPHRVQNGSYTEL